MTAPEHASTIARAPGPPVAVWWLIGVSLAVIAVCLVFRSDDRPGGQVFAQPTGMGGARGVFAFTGQLSKEAYGVYMVDVDAGTIWCYRYNATKSVLQLVAARDWRYDRYLPNHATEPPPEVIKEQLERIRAAALRQEPAAP